MLRHFRMRPGDTLLRSIKTAIADLKKGDHIRHNQKVVVIDAVSSVQKGRGSRTFNVTARELVPPGPDAGPAAVVSVRPQPHFDVLELVDKHLIYTYASGDDIVLLDEKTLEETCVSRSLLSPQAMRLLESGERLRLRVTDVTREDSMQAQSEHVSLHLPNTLKCTIQDVVPIGSAVIAVTLGGAKVSCPPIVSPGDRIAVDPSTGNYLSRAHN